jgi:peptidoglycan-associated lipoprotein
MIRRTLVLPFICCLSAFGLAGCPDSTSTTEPPKITADRQPDNGNARPSIDQKAGSLADVGDRVFFAYDSSLLSADAARTLQRQAAWLQQFPALHLTVEGHSDERGTREFNLALGERRANAVRDYLVAQGIASNRIRTVSYGKERPVVASHDESSWAQNRRGVSVVQ